MIGSLGEGQCAPNWTLEEDVGGASDTGGEVAGDGSDVDSGGEPDLRDMQMMSGDPSPDTDAGPEVDAMMRAGGTSPPSPPPSGEPGGCLQEANRSLDTSLWLFLLILGITRRHSVGRVDR